MRNYVMALSAGLLVAPASSQSAPASPQGPQAKELGAVPFARDLDAVLKQKPTKPVFLLFQEIPG